MDRITHKESKEIIEDWMEFYIGEIEFIRNKPYPPHTKYDPRAYDTHMRDRVEKAQPYYTKIDGLRALLTGVKPEPLM